MTVPFLNLQITISDIRPHIKWDAAWWLQMVTLTFLRGLCGYVWITYSLYHPRGEMDYILDIKTAELNNDSDCKFIKYEERWQKKAKAIDMCFLKPQFHSLYFAEYDVFALLWQLLVLNIALSGHDPDSKPARTSKTCTLTLTVLVATIDAQWEGMGDVGSAKYEPALLPSCPTIRVLSYSN